MSPYTQQRQIISDRGATIKPICADAAGRYQLDDEYGEPGVYYRYSELIDNGHTGISLGSGDGEDTASLKSLCDMCFPRNALKSESGANFLKITRIVRNCKCAISQKLAKNFDAQEGIDSFNSSYISRGIVDPEEKSGEFHPEVYKQKRFSSEKNHRPSRA